jgi:hypothetical protein
MQALCPTLQASHDRALVLTFPGKSIFLISLWEQRVPHCSSEQRRQRLDVPGLRFASCAQYSAFVKWFGVLELIP